MITEEEQMMIALRGEFMDFAKCEFDPDAKHPFITLVKMHRRHNGSDLRSSRNRSIDYLNTFYPGFLPIEFKKTY